MKAHFSSSTRQSSASKKGRITQRGSLLYKNGMLFVILLSFLLLIVTRRALAVDISLSLPGLPQDANPAQMIGGLYTYALSIGGLLAFGMVVYGGVKYTLSAGNPGMASDAKDTIYQALLGLLLLLAAYLILTIVNPGLTTLTLPTLQPLPDTAPSAGSGAAGAPCENVCQDPKEECRIDGSGQPQCQAIGNVPNYSAVLAQNQLMNGAGEDFARQNGLSIKPGVSLNGVHQGVLEELVNTKKACDIESGGGCSLTITAGTDGQHAPGEFSHAAGYKVDVRSSGAADKLNSFITSSQYFEKIGTRTDGAEQWRDKRSGAIWARESTHWDILAK